MELDDAAKATLSTLAAQLKQNPALRVNFLAYAQADDTQQSRSRRIALRRGFNARIYLINEGIDSLRMNIKAMGSNGAGDQPNRVDIVLTGSENS